MSISNTTKFNLGQVVMTSSISNFINKDIANELFVINCIKRHHKADWGDCCTEDSNSNDDALINSGRLLSSYKITNPDSPVHLKIWIITEWDRSVTTVLFPSDY